MDILIHILKVKLVFGDQPLQISGLKNFLECGTLRVNTREVPGIVDELVTPSYILCI